jgi:SPP1 gp7 family putative phage head morphogenesis protein
MSIDIRHTKKQVTLYHKQIKSLVLVPLQTSIVQRLASVPETDAAWQQVFEDTFGDADYVDSVSQGADDISRVYIDDLASWQKAKMKTQFKQLFGVDVLPMLKESQTKAELDPIIAENIGLIKSISPELNTQVQEQYSKILYADGFDQPKILNMLTKRFSVSNSRAKLIASDQTGKTIGALASTRQSQAGVTQFVWRTAEDERVRPDHAALDGTVFSWSMPPSIGVPGQPIRCRCVAIPYIAGVS